MRSSRWHGRRSFPARAGALALGLVTLAGIPLAVRGATDASASDLARVATVYRFAIDVAGYPPQGTLDAIAASFREYRHYTTLTPSDVPELHDARDDAQNVAQIDALIETFEHHLGSEAVSDGASVDGAAVARWAIEAIAEDDLLPAAQYRATVAGPLGDTIPSFGFSYGYDPAAKAVLVREVEPASPAALGGLAVGDRIAAAGAVELSADREAAAQALAGDTVTLHVIGGGAPRDVTLNRMPIRFSTVGAATMISGIAYLRVHGIGAATASDLARALADPGVSDARGLVSDLRHAVSGTIGEAIDFASAFVPAGTKVGIRVRDDRKQALFTHDAPAIAPTVPIAILVGRETAGSTELSAAALRNAHRAKLVGETTAGSDRLEVRTQLDTGEGLVLGNGAFVLPGNTADDDAETRALTPDRSVPRARDARVDYSRDPTRDLQLAAAIALLRTKR